MIKNKITTILVSYVGGNKVKKICVTLKTKYEVLHQMKPPKGYT